MAVPKTLILTPTPPGDGNVGEVYLRETLKAFPQESVSCYAAWPAEYQTWLASPQLQSLPLEFAELPPEPTKATAFGALIGNMHSCFVRRAHWRQLNPIMDDIAEFARTQNVERIFAFISTPETVRLARKVAKRLDLPFFLHISELPQTYMTKRGYDLVSKASVIRYFSELINSAQLVLVSSRGMQQHLQQHYKVPSVALGYPIESVKRPHVAPGSMAPYTVAYQETPGASEQLIGMLTALRAANWQINGRDVVLKVIGNVLNFPLYAAGRNAHLEFINTRSLAENVDILAECDAAYLPWTTNKQFSAEARTAVPDAFITYLSAGLPMLFHGASDAWVASFIRKYQVGINCHQLDNTKLSAALQLLLSDEEVRRIAHAGAREAYAKKLSEAIFAANLQRALEIEVREAVPV